MRLTPLLVGVLCCLSFVPANAETAEKAPNLIPNPELRLDSKGLPIGWKLWTPRPILAPAGTAVVRDGVPMLSLHADRYECDGRWVAVVNGIEPGKYYRLEAAYSTENVGWPTMSVAGLLIWADYPDGRGEIQTDYLDDERTDAGPWHRSYRTIQAPEGARSVRVELGLRVSKGGTVYWKNIRLVAVPPPAPRRVRIVTTMIYPWPNPSVEANTRLMANMLDAASRERPDIVLFSEGVVDRGVWGVPLSQKAQTIPGPLTQMLSEKARKYHTYIITTLHERDGDLYHNTAVLIDRQGRVAGTYRKVHLALAETDAGLTPGDNFPVFDTDFGRIGILICYDNWFVEPARILRMEGAEIIFLPLAGDGVPGHADVIFRERAIDNGVYFVTSATVSDTESRIIDPAGEVLAEATGSSDMAVKEIDLNREWRGRYLSVASGVGEGKSLYIKERRPDTYSILCKGADQPVPANK